MAKKETYRKKLDWIVNIIVIGAVVLLVLISLQQEGGLDGLTRLKDAVMQELWADGPLHTPAPAENGIFEPSLRVHFINVGQGKSILIEAPEKTVLIDAGENNMGELVLRYLGRHSIEKLDIAIGTHPHSDHIGGLDTVMLEMLVDKVILPVIPDELSPTSSSYIDLLNAIKNEGLKITPARPNDKYELGGGAVLTVLAPVSGDYTDINDFSIVSRLDYGSASFIFTGDMTASAENELIDSDAKLRASVLDVGHHGSRDSTSEAFLYAVNPRIAVISCGVDNSYGHPHRDTMRRFESVSDLKILRTDLDGSVIISSDGKQLSYEAEKAA